MNNKQVAHLWANQSKASAKGSNFFFENDVIYSYGRHFPIAKIFASLIFYNSGGYSISTAKHQSIVRSSIDYSKFRVIELPYIESLNLDNLVYLENKIIDLKSKFLTSRKYKEQIQNAIIKTIEDYRIYSKLLKIKPKRAILTYDKNLYKAEIEKQKLKAEIANNKRLALESVKRQAELNKFLNGDEKIKTIEYRAGTNFLKIVGEKCITNNGAEVELLEVKNIISSMLKYNSKIISGQKIGNFTVNNHDETGIKIGCHFFDTQEINRIIELFK